MKLTLPQLLRSHSTALQQALARPVLGVWPEDESYLDAEQPAAVGKVLIGALHKHLVGAKVGYLYVERMVHGERITLGKVKRAGGQLHHLTDLDFVMVISFEAWKKLKPEGRLALVDHELCHCGRDTETGRYLMVEHDVEEFGAIVRRWGLWKDDLAQFGRDVGAQLSLLDGGKAGAEREAGT